MTWSCHSHVKCDWSKTANEILVHFYSLGLIESFSEITNNFFQITFIYLRTKILHYLPKRSVCDKAAHCTTVFFIIFYIVPLVYNKEYLFIYHLRISNCFEVFSNFNECYPFWKWYLFFMTIITWTVTV